MNSKIVLYALLASIALASGCAKLKVYKSDPMIMADGSVKEVTVAEFTNPWGQNGIIMESHQSVVRSTVHQPAVATTQPADRLLAPPMVITATAVSTDRGVGANVLPGAVTGTAYVLGKAVEDPARYNNVTKVNGGNATGGTGNGGSGGSGTGGAGGNGGDGGTGGQGGAGGSSRATGGNANSAPQVRVGGPVVNNNNHAVATNRNHQGVGVNNNVGVNVNNQQGQGQGQGQGQNNRPNRWSDPSDFNPVHHHPDR
ncbi:MAG: hypothetical protein V4519_01880 [Patescibacteria group bacterium]